MPFALMELPLVFTPRETASRALLADQLLAFREFGQNTRELETQTRTFAGEALSIRTFVNEFWTAKQRAASRLHEISYRACFKPQLPRFFIERLTLPGDRVYDPFMGRGTTLVEAALLSRVPLGCDANPLSVVLTRPRLRPPTLEQIDARLKQINFSDVDEFPEDLLVFYHPETLREIVALKKYLRGRREAIASDEVDDWICLIGRASCRERV